MPRLYQIIDPPAPAPLPFGLLSVVQPLDVTSDHWQNGIIWQSRCPSPGGTLTYDECIAVTGSGGPPPAQPTKVDNVNRVQRAATSFTPYLEIDCSPVGSGDLAGYIRRTYEAIEPFAVERALWTGVAGNGAQVVYPRLAANAQVVDADGVILQTVPVTGGPFKPGDALGFLEAQMAACLGTVGTIHVPRRAMGALGGQFTATGGQMKTKSGNLVAVGSGYTGASPAGQAPAASQAWVYGTGQIFGKWGDIRVLDSPGAFDRSNNTLKMIAERTYLFGWDCCHVGVLVDLSGS